jgi:3'-phosphoadenosine 5'-phosphosulfate sulfotransferase (PAPS reductase)/FAD synthetase
MGIRGEESESRMERGAITVFGKSKRAMKMLEKLRETFSSTDSQVSCEGGQDRVNIYPIFDLTEKEIWKIIRAEKLAIPDAYGDCKRLGCAFCPFVSFRENCRTIKNMPNLTKAWLKVLSDTEFQEKRQKGLFGKTNGAGLFYLYIKKSLYSDKDIEKGLDYLRQKDLYGKTGLQKFEDFLEENGIKTALFK